jgi:hypothetical protein
VNLYLPPKQTLAGFLLLSVLLSQSLTQAELKEKIYIPKSIEVSSQLVPVSGIADLKFNEFYKTPVGPKGLELTPKLVDLIGKKVRIVGYMAKTEPATSGMFILSPFPVDLGDEDEKLVDDFPPNVIFVQLSDKTLAVPTIQGLIKLTGTLRVGSFEEVDGHVSSFRLELDPEIVKDLKQALGNNSTAQK